MQIFTNLLLVLLFDAIVIGLFALALIPLARLKHAAFAVLKRNFVSYFSTPTGYVFLCLFVLLTSFAAFWPHEFFSSNMATLDQLNKFLPYIMLIFIPAIAMSIWADERRQGTDELLLTIPATDFDIVLGKYLASAAIFTASLVFSQLSNFAVLNALAMGEGDLGLFLATYAGYWLIGMAMLALGMIASFLTANLTVGFILGAAINVPLAFAASADVIIPSTSLAQTFSFWSLLTQFEPFGRGVISLASIIYFSMIVVVGVYVSMVLIGRRHWQGGRDGKSMLGHYVVRIVALLAIAVAASGFFSNHDLIRYDATKQKVSSLSKDTYKLIGDLDHQSPVIIEAFISSTLPETFIKTKFDLVSLIREIDAAGSNISVTIRDNMEPFSDDAQYAEQRYGIRPVVVQTQSQGSFKQEEVFLAAAFTCGLERVVVPFFGQGSPVEYELVRSVCTVADQAEQAQRRKLIGVVKTDASMMGGFNMQTFQQTPPQAIIQELRKQYTVEEVDPSSPINLGQYDTLLVVQPSSLTQPQLDNLSRAILAGQPTALFEDPFPARWGGTPGTDMPKRPAGGGMMGMQQPPEQKGNINQLWKSLGVALVRAEEGRQGQAAGFGMAGSVNWTPFTPIVYQEYTPYPKDRSISDAAIFANPNAPGGEGTFNPNEGVVADFQEVLFLAPGAFEEQKDPSDPTTAGLTFTPLVTIGTNTGLMTANQLMNENAPALLRSVGAISNDAGQLKGDYRLRTRQRYTLAARVQKPALDPEISKKPALDVVLVSDIDVLESLFLSLRNQPSGPIQYNFQNVAFVLNIVDSLAGDDRFLNIRKRRTHHATLKLIEQKINDAEESTRGQIDQFQTEITKSKSENAAKRQQAVAVLQSDLQKLVDQSKNNEAAIRAAVGVAQQKLAWQEARNQREQQNDEQRLARELQEELRRIQRELELNRAKIQNEYKFWAVVLPPFPPLLVALAVFARRRLRERDGVSKARLR